MSRKKPATALLKLRPPADVIAILRENSPDGDFRAFGEKKALALLEEWAAGKTVSVTFDEEELEIFRRARPEFPPLSMARNVAVEAVCAWLADRRREQKLKDLAKVDPDLLREALGLDLEGEDAGYGKKAAPPGWEGAKSRGETEEAGGGPSEPGGRDDRDVS